MTVVETILAQLGGRRFIAMTGAKDFVGGDNTLMFSIGRNQSQANRVKITYQPGSDLYDIEFGRIRKFEYKALDHTEGLDVEQMRDHFTRYTGLLLSLGRR